jgi:hypothetical protein
MIRKLEGASALSTLHAVMGAKSPLDEMPISDVRRIGRSNSVVRTIENNERIDRELIQLAIDVTLNEAPKATFASCARNAPTAKKNASDASIEIARHIAGNALPSDHLVTGMHAQLNNLREVLRWKGKERSLTELRDLANQVHRSAAYLQSFPENGQLPKARMAKAEKAATVLQDCLRNTELLSYLFKDRPAIVDPSFADGLDIVLQRAAGSSDAKNGRPKKQPDIQLPDRDKFVSVLAHIVDLAHEGASGEKVKKTMTPEFDDANRFSPQLLCAVIVGMAYSTALSDAAPAKDKVHWYRRRVRFKKDASKACEMLWRAAGGKEHDQDASYTCWEEDHIPNARKPSCGQLVRATRRSFR